MGVLRATAKFILEDFLGMLEPVMREGFVGFSHAMHFLAFFYRAATAFRCLGKFARKARAHGFFPALARSIAHPAHGQRSTTNRPHFHWHLVIGATDAAAFHFDHRP